MSPKHILACVLAALLSGCATQRGMVSAYTDLPATCEANAAEILALADADALAANVNFAAAQAPAAAAYAAAAGLVPAGWAWAPTIAAAISYYRQGTHEGRINYLAQQRLHLDCPTLRIPEPAPAAPVAPQSAAPFGL